MQTVEKRSDVDLEQGWYFYLNDINISVVMVIAFDCLKMWPAAAKSTFRTLLYVTGFVWILFRHSVSSASSI